MDSCGIMQPYFFPYIGYFQLIHAVDNFVFYDDVTYIKGGWINRNNLLLNGEKRLVTVPLNGASSNRLINEIEIAKGGKYRKIIKSINQAYSKAPYQKEIMQILKYLWGREISHVSSFNIDCIKAISQYIGIDTKFYVSSLDFDNKAMNRQDRIVDICNQLNSGHYINALGGQTLYTKQFFEERGITLNFLQSNDILYSQFNHQFVPWLSMIDILMFNSKKEIQHFLDKYTLV